MSQTIYEQYLKHSWLLAIAVTFVALFPTLSNGWVNGDEIGYIQDNPLVKELSFSNVARMFSEPIMANYHPLTLFSYAIDYDLGGGRPFVFHVTNLLLHLANVFLVFWLVQKLFKRTWLAFVIALLFGVHPMHVESVASIAQRKDVLYALFFLLAHISYINYATGEQRSKNSYWKSLLFFVLALLSKPMAVTLPVIMLLTDYFLERKWSLRLIYEKLPFFVFAIVFAVVAIKTQSDSSATVDISQIPAFTPLFVASFALSTYLVKAFIPYGLSAYHPYPDPTSWDLPWYYYVSIVVPLVLALICVYYRKKSTLLVFGLLYWMISLLPVLQLVPVGAAVYAERYTYLPYLGLFMLLGLIPAFSKKSAWRYALIGFGVYIVSLAIISFQRSKVWQDPRTLWSDVIKDYPEDFMGYWSRGNFYLQEENYEIATLDYHRAIDRNPAFYSIWHNLGIAEAHTGHLQEAADAFTQAIDRNPDFEGALLNRGITFFEMGEDFYALKDFEAVTRLDPDNVQALTHLGVLYKRVGAYRKAVEQYSHAITLDPTSSGLYYNRGVAYFFNADFESAIQDFGHTIELNPRHAGAAYFRSQCYFNLGQIDEARSDANLARILGYSVEPEYAQALGLADNNE